MEEARSVVVMHDKSFSIHDVITGRKDWSPKDKRICISYAGSHRKTAVYGLLTKDGRQFFRIYDKFVTTTTIPPSSHT